MRIGFLEEQLRFQPRSSRLLRRLAESYAALAEVIRLSGARRLPPREADLTVSEVGQARRIARRYFDQAIRSAHTHESLCRALEGEAMLFRHENDPVRAARCLERLLAVEPNNWLAALETATVYRRLGEWRRALHDEAQAARWRTPGWV